MYFFFFFIENESNCRNHKYSANTNVVGHNLTILGREFLAAFGFFNTITVVNQ